MSARKFDLVVEQGADFELAIPVLDDDAQPVLLSGWSAAGQIRPGHYAAAPLLHTLDLEVVGTSVVLRIPASASSAWTWRRALFDVEVVAPDGKVTRLVEGAVVVSPEITR